MEDILDKWDILTTAPLAVLLLVYMYLNNAKVTKLIENYHKLIEKLIDKMK